MEAVLRYLDKVDPNASRRARYRYGCFEQFGEDTQTYGYAAGFALSQSCEREVVEQLLELGRRAADYAHRFAAGTWRRRSTRWSGIWRRRGPGAKVVVWAHNSHLGDTRATRMAEEGELNLGQLVRERYPARRCWSA